MADAVVTLGVTHMTELGDRTRFATAVLLVVGMGCSTPAPIEKVPTEKTSPGGNKVEEEPVRPEPHTLGFTPTFKAQTIYLEALKLFGAREFDLAYLEFSRALDVDPNYYLAWHKKGLCAYYKQRYELEIDCYRRCLEIKPDFMEGLQSLGAAYLTLDYIERAVPIYRRMLVIEATQPVALYNLAACYHELQDYPASIEHFRRFIEAHPHDPSRPKAEELLRKVRQKLEARELEGTQR